MQSIAITTLVAYFLLLPGMLFVNAYSAGGIVFWFLWMGKTRRTDKPPGNPSHPASSRGFWENAFSGALVSFILHIVWGMMIYYCLRQCRHAPDLDELLASIIKGPTPDGWGTMTKGWGKWWIVSYFLGLYAFSAASGRIMLAAVRGLHLDRLTKWIRFRDKYYYYFRGEVREFGENDPNSPGPKRIGDVVATIALEVGGVGMVQKGLVRDWQTDADGTLSHIIVLPTERSCIAGMGPSSFIDQVDFDGHYCMIPGDQIRSLTIEYIPPILLENNRI